jgi:plastocyanin
MWKGGDVGATPRLRVCSHGNNNDRSSFGWLNMVRVVFAPGLFVGVIAAVIATATVPIATAHAGESSSWPGDEMPLPITVKTAQDMAFKTVAERLYLTFNLMASGRLAWQRGDYAGAAEKWETLLRTPGLDPQVERVIAPLLADARRRAGSRPAGAAPIAPAPSPTPPTAEVSPVASTARPAVAKPVRPDVTGVVLGGGDVGPAGAVVWLKRLDGRTPQVAPTSGRFITQRKKTFLPHVLAIPKGSTVEFRNEDAIYHNAFSLDKPNDFDAGIRAKGNTYSRTFAEPGPVEILCNIHASMNAFVVVVDSPYFTKTSPSGTFSIAKVPPGQYELSVWHETASNIIHKKISVGAAGASGISVSVEGDKKPRAFVPDKYEHKRQPHLGY